MINAFDTSQMKEYEQRYKAELYNIRIFGNENDPCIAPSNLGTTGSSRNEFHSFGALHATGKGVVA